MTCILSKHQLLLLAGLFIFLPIVFSLDPYLEVAIGDTVNIEIPCSYNGGSCPSNTECNITLSYPNTTQYINRSQMQRLGDTFNYSIPNMTQNGDHRAYTLCCGGDVCDAEYYIVRVPGKFEYNKCPSTLPGILGYFLILGIIITVIFIGYLLNHTLVGMTGATMLIVFGIFMGPCILYIGYGLVMVGLLLFIHLALRKV